MCDCDFLPHYFIWSTEDTQQLYPNRLGFQWACACMQVCGHSKIELLKCRLLFHLFLNESLNNNFCLQDLSNTGKMLHWLPWTFPSEHCSSMSHNFVSCCSLNKLADNLATWCALSMTSLSRLSSRLSGHLFRIYLLRNKILRHIY